MALVVTAIPTSSPTNISPATKTTNSYSNYKRLLTLINTKCTNISQLKQIHAQTLRTTSFHDPYTFFLYSRILHFASLNHIPYAFDVFTQIPSPNSFMWNTLIQACANTNDCKERSLLVYVKMLEDGSVFPDKHTFPFVLKACAYLFALREGEQIYSHVVKFGFGSDVYVNNSLIHFYLSCGYLVEPRKLFDEMPQRSLVTWNVMIDGLVQMGEFDKGVELFRRMQGVFEPDSYGLISAVNACGGLRCLGMGMWVHGYVLRKCGEDVVNDVLINSCLVDMYCKCGRVDLGREVFERMKTRDVNSWNTMILGLAMHGQAKAALDYFDRVNRTERFKPNSITFVGVLSACNHGGLVDEGRKYFNMMSNVYNVMPVLEHYGCLVDLFARSGLIDEALDIVATMPMRPDVVIWRSLLDACCKKNVSLELSEEVAWKIIESEGGDSSGPYVLLSRVYASASRWSDVGLIRRLMTDKGVNKEPGCSSIEIDGTAHEFFAGDTSHPQTVEIYQMLDAIDERLNSAGYKPDYSQAPLVDDISDGKQQSLRLHSERIAIAFGLLKSKPGVPIRVFKNLRVCNDCHRVTKLISGIFNVEIIVRDRARFHHFKSGSCSCTDYW